MNQFVRKLVPDDRTVATISRELKDLFGRSAQAFYPRDLLRKGDRRDPHLTFMMQACRIRSWEFFSTWCRYVGESTVRPDCISIECDAPPPEKRDSLAKLAGNPVMESSWYFRVTPPSQTGYKSGLVLQLYANEHEHEDSRLLVSTRKDPSPEVLPLYKQFWETVTGTIDILNGVELMVGDSGRWGPKPIDEGKICTEHRAGEQPTKINARFGCELITTTLMELFKAIEQLAPDLVLKDGYPLIAFDVQPHSIEAATKLLYEKDDNYRIRFLGAYHKDFSPEELGLGSAFPAEGFWRFPLMAIDHRSAGYSLVDYVWTPTERFIEISSSLDKKKLMAFLRRKKFDDCFELWEGVPGERWGLRARTDRLTCLTITRHRDITTKCTGAAKLGVLEVDNHWSRPGDFRRYPAKTMPEKKFYIPAEDIKQLVDHNGGCIATDMITVDGYRVGYMYREPPSNEADMGWRFMASDESDEYMESADNHGVYAVNTIANCDNDILPFLDAPIGSAFARNSETGEFEPVDSPVDPDDCLHPDFPVVTGHYQLSSSWSVSLPLKFNRRIEDGSLILWRPGVTLYFNAWNNDDDESIDTRLAQLKADVSPDAFEHQERQAGSIQQFSYRLIEDGANALYGFVIANGGHLQVAVYCDDKSDIDLARSMFTSVTEDAG